MSADSAVDNSLDDIFGSSPPPETAMAESSVPHTAPPTSTAEPSDLPSLRRQHVTAGYREGVSASKGQHVQRGFDAGYPVGAQVGMRAGTVLGILEGIARGLEEDRSISSVVKKPARGAAGSASASHPAESGDKDSDSRQRAREQVLKVYGDAVKALDVQAVFTGFEAGAETGSMGDDGKSRRQARELAEVQLGRKGDAVVAGWEGRVAVPRWEENMDTLEMNGQDRSQSQGQGEDKGAAGERS